MSGVQAEALGRDALAGLVERYLDALVAHDASRLPAAPGVRFTENGQPLPLGSGRWATVSGRQPGGQVFVDPQAGQVAFWGAVTEAGEPIIFSVRLGTEAGLVSEVETLIVRPGGLLFDPGTVCAPRPAFHEVVAPAERSSREEMIRAANLYFDGIERDDGDIVPLADGCVRIENGVQTTGNAPSAELDAQAPWRTMGIAAQLNAGHFQYIEAIRDRRFPVLDEERGLVVCHAVFDHPGNIETVDGRIPFGYPTSVMIAEVFKVKGGLIHHVEAVGTVFPYGIATGW